MFKISKLPFIFSVFVFVDLLKYNVAAAASSSDISNNLQLEEQTRFEDGFMWDIILVLLALVFVVFLLYYTVKFLANRNKTFLSPKGIRSLGGIGIGANSSVQVLYIGEKIYIVGVGQQVTLLDKESDPESVQKILDSFEASEQPAFASIKDFITNLKRKKQDDNTDVGNVDWNKSSNHAFENLLQEKLDKQAERKQQLESLLKDKNE